MQYTIIEFVWAALFVLGVHKAMQPGAILGWISGPIEDYIAKLNFHEQWNAASFLRYLTNPLYACLPCMASFWGVAFLWMRWNANLFTDILVFICILCGINFLLANVIALIQSKITIE